jgi:hypothetical protein
MFTDRILDFDHYRCIFRTKLFRCFRKTDIVSVFRATVCDFVSDKKNIKMVIVLVFTDLFHP